MTLNTDSYLATFIPNFNEAYECDDYDNADDLLGVALIIGNDPNIEEDAFPMAFDGEETAQTTESVLHHAFTLLSYFDEIEPEVGLADYYSLPVADGAVIASAVAGHEITESFNNLLVAEELTFKAFAIWLVTIVDEAINN